jgi:hypothetical protein
MKEWKLTRLIGLVVGITWLIYPYVAGSWLSALRADKVKSVCSSEAKIVVLGYSELNSTAQVYCLYRDAKQNTRYTVSQRAGGEWSILTTDNVGKGFYWPFWL